MPKNETNKQPSTIFHYQICIGDLSHIFTGYRIKPSIKNIHSVWLYHFSFPSNVHNNKLGPRFTQSLGLQESLNPFTPLNILHIQNKSAHSCANRKQRTFKKNCFEMISCKLFFKNLNVYLYMIQKINSEHSDINP